MLNETLFTSLAQVRAVLAKWKHDYNTVRPHSALGNLSPADADRSVPGKQRDGALRYAEGSAPDPVPSPGLTGSNDLGTFPYRWMSREAQVNDAPRTMAKSGIAYLTSTMHDG